MNKRNTIKQLLHRGCLLMGISAITSSAFAWDFAEHRKIGDRAMSLLPRYLVENGIFPNEAVADSALLQILNMSHMPGSNAYAMNELTQLPNIVTYGTLCGLAGDHVENLGDRPADPFLQDEPYAGFGDTSHERVPHRSQQQGAARHQSGLRYPSDQGSLPLLRLWQGIERASEDDRPRADPPPSTPLGSKQGLR